MWCCETIIHLREVVRELSHLWPIRSLYLLIITSVLHLVHTGLAVELETELAGETGTRLSWACQTKCGMKWTGKAVLELEGDSDHGRQLLLLPQRCQMPHGIWVKCREQMSLRGQYYYLSIITPLMKCVKAGRLTIKNEERSDLWDDLFFFDEIIT